MPETRKQRYQKLFAQLKNERSSFEGVWNDLSQFIRPNRYRRTTEDVNRGDRKWKKIIDATGTFSARTLASGMMAGVSSPARPWFRLTTPDPGMSEFGPVKQWLDDVRELMVAVLLRSNIYNKLPVMYGDMGTFATGAIALMEDDDAIIRAYDFPLGSYYIANDDQMRVRVFARELRMTVRQVVRKFGRIGLNGQPDWSRFSTMVRNAWERGNYEQWVDICHVVDPNMGYDPERIASQYKPFLGCYYEKGGEGDRLLEERGFDEFPILSPRWEVGGEDAYGTDCPGMTALGDVMTLQHGEKRGAQGLDKLVNPPLVGPSGLRNAAPTSLPGGITYYDLRDGMQGFQPLYQVDIRLDLLENRQEAVRNRIRRAYYEDLFLMLEQLEKSDVTATEILERKQEKLLVLGPMLEQLNQDALDPMIDRVFGAMSRRGMIPPPPQELEGVPLKVEYVSIMAQAQKETGLASLERFSGFATNLAQFDPAALDKIDRDQLIDEYAEMTGVPPRVVVPDEQVAEIRKARAQAQQAAQAAEAAKALAPAAKQLSETNIDQPSALSALMGSGGGGALQ